MLTVTSGSLTAFLGTFSVCAAGLHQVFDRTKMNLYALGFLIPDLLFIQDNEALYVSLPAVFLLGLRDPYSDMLAV